jgi:hypothetical protein
MNIGLAMILYSLAIKGNHIRYIGVGVLLAISALASGFLLGFLSLLVASSVAGFLDSYIVTMLWYGGKMLRAESNF